jgi:hypothetical protein
MARRFADAELFENEALRGGLMPRNAKYPSAALLSLLLATGAMAWEQAVAAPILYGTRNYFPGGHRGTVTCNPPLPGPYGSCPVILSVYYAVYDQTGGTAADPWGINPTLFYSLDTPGHIDFSAFDGSAKYLYLYEFAEGGEGISLGSGFLTGGKPFAVTSTGSLPHAAFGTGPFPSPPQVVADAIWARETFNPPIPNADGSLFLRFGVGPDEITQLAGFTSNELPGPGSLALTGIGETYIPPVRSRVTIRSDRGDVVAAGIPEPGTIPLVGVGIVMVAVWNWKIRGTSLVGRD